MKKSIGTCSGFGNYGMHVKSKQTLNRNSNEKKLKNQGANQTWILNGKSNWKSNGKLSNTTEQTENFVSKLILPNHIVFHPINQISDFWQNKLHMSEILANFMFGSWMIYTYFCIFMRVYRWCKFGIYSQQVNVSDT